MDLKDVQEICSTVGMRQAPSTEVLEDHASYSGRKTLLALNPSNQVVYNVVMKGCREVRNREVCSRASYSAAKEYKSSRPGASGCFILKTCMGGIVEIHTIAQLIPWCKESVVVEEKEKVQLVRVSMRWKSRRLIIIRPGGVRCDAALLRIWKALGHKVQHSRVAKYICHGQCRRSHGAEAVQLDDYNTETVSLRSEVFDRGDGVQ